MLIVRILSSLMIYNLVQNLLGHYTLAHETSSKMSKKLSVESMIVKTSLCKAAIPHPHPPINVGADIYI